MNFQQREHPAELLRSEFLTLKEVLCVTKLSRTTIWQLVRAGKLRRCPNTGRALRFTVGAVRDCFAPKENK
jgi:predicted DNA-binding transcriptional regulator AlpA